MYEVVIKQTNKTVFFVLYLKWLLASLAFQKKQSKEARISEAI